MDKTYKFDGFIYGSYEVTTTDCRRAEERAAKRISKMMQEKTGGYGMDWKVIRSMLKEKQEDGTFDFCL